MSPTPPQVRSTSLLPTQGAFLFLLAAVVLAAIAVYGRSGATVPWFVVVAGASVAAFLAGRSILRTIKDPEPPRAPRRIERETPGELGALAEIWNRARSGYGYSQALVVTRVTEAFLEKVRLTRGLSAEEVERARTDRVRLRALVGDPILVDFLYVDERFGRNAPLGGLAKVAFGQALARTLDAMEAWP